jgi:hypothetical protein
MKRIKTIVMIVPALLFLSSCQKDKDKNNNASLPFSPAGYWVGTMNPGSIEILNRPDGSSRLYLLVNNHDTASTSSKFDGTYSAGSNSFYFQSSTRTDGTTVHMQTTQATPTFMSGVFILKFSSLRDTTITLPFEIVRQL